MTRDTGDGVERLTLTIEPDAALTILNERDWTEGEMGFAMVLADSVRTGETLETEVPKDAE